MTFGMNIIEYMSHHPAMSGMCVTISDVNLQIFIKFHRQITFKITQVPLNTTLQITPFTLNTTLQITPVPLNTTSEMFVNQQFQT
jgi:hypothetical protein